MCRKVGRVCLAANVRIACAVHCDGVAVVFHRSAEVRGVGDRRIDYYLTVVVIISQRERDAVFGVNHEMRVDGLSLSVQFLISEWAMQLQIARCRGEHQVARCVGTKSLRSVKSELDSFGISPRINQKIEFEFVGYLSFKCLSLNLRRAVICQVHAGINVAVADLAIMCKSATPLARVAAEDVVGHPRQLVLSADLRLKV